MRAARGDDPAGRRAVLARFYMVLDNEYITTVIEGTAKPAAAREFHTFIDDAFGSTSGT